MHASRAMRGALAGSVRCLSGHKRRSPRRAVSGRHSRFHWAIQWCAVAEGGLLDVVDPTGRHGDELRASSVRRRHRRHCIDPLCRHGECNVVRPPNWVWRVAAGGRLSALAFGGGRLRARAVICLSGRGCPGGDDYAGSDDCNSHGGERDEAAERLGRGRLAEAIGRRKPARRRPRSALSRSVIALGREPRTRSGFAFAVCSASGTVTSRRSSGDDRQERRDPDRSDLAASRRRLRASRVAVSQGKRGERDQPVP